MGSAAHPRDGHALAPDMLDRPPQYSATCRAFILLLPKLGTSALGAVFARRSPPRPHAGTSRGSTRDATRAAHGCATKAASLGQLGEQENGQPTGYQETKTGEGKIKAASRGGPKWPPRLPKNVGVPEAEYPAAAPSARPGSGIGRMARTNLEKSAEIRGSSGFPQNCGNGLGFFANQPV